MGLLGIIASGPTALQDLSFSTVVTDRNGRPLRIFLTDDEKYRIYKPLADIPREFLDIVMLQEDRHFFSHPGVNPVSIIRAGWQTYVARERQIGGSTITMQLARLRYGLYTRSIRGKLRQIFTAMILEIRENKQQLLEAYVNLVPCGGNIEGYPAAALYYFGKDIAQLTPSEQFLLAVIPQDPLERAPQAGHLPTELLSAREILATNWLDYYGEDEILRTAIQMPVDPVCRFPLEALHVTDVLAAEFENPPLIHSTIDLDIQNIAERTLTRYLLRRSYEGVDNGAILVADHRSLEVVAAVGSADYFNDDILGQIPGFTAKRSPGSTLKPFVYALAMDHGLIIPNSIVKDAASSFSEYTPDNYAGDFQGAVQAWKALVDSRNIPAISLANQLEEQDLYGLLSQAGIAGLKNRDHYGLSIVLGSAEVTMIELAGLYASLANSGLYSPLTFHNEDEHSHTERLVSVESAWLTFYMLAQNPPPFQTRPMENRDIPIAFKTGTSIGFKDAWCAAIAGPYVVIVWIGRFDGEGDPAFLGRSMATPLLFELTEVLLSRDQRDRGYAPGPRPRNLRQVSLCTVSGALPNEHCPHTEPGWFIPGVSPIQRCSIHRLTWIDVESGYRSDGPTENSYAEVREFWDSDMLELFAQAGLPRLVPPAYPPDSSQRTRNIGSPPTILYPLEGAVYLLEDQEYKRRSIPLTASADADSRELFWFADTKFLGRSPAGETLFWEAQVGNYTVTVLDNAGRSSSIDLNVTEAPVNRILEPDE